MKICITCLIEKNENNFYIKSGYLRKQCKDCYNEIRRGRYKLSKCRYCKKDYKPQKKGFGRYCQEKCRFADKVKIDKNSKCWVWQGHKNITGYGTFVKYGWKKSGLAHRASFLIFKGNIEKGLLVCHHCDNPPCVNPDHLFLGNNKENQVDCEKKKRRMHPSKEELLKRFNNLK